MSTQNEPNMKWNDGSHFSTLIFMSHEVSLKGLCCCQGALEDATSELLSTTLGLGHPFHIDTSALKDNMGNTQPECLLFTDRVNADTIGPVDQLAQHIIDTPSLQVCKRSLF